MSTTAAHDISQMEQFVRKWEIPLRNRPSSTLQMALHEPACSAPAGQAIQICDRKTYLKIKTSQKIAEAAEDLSTVVECVLARDKTVASLSANGEICLWDVATGQCKEILSRRGYGCNAKFLCSNESGEYLASGHTDGSIRIWSVANCKCINSLQFYGTLESLNLSQNGSNLCASGCSLDDEGVIKSKVCMWNVHSGQCTNTSMMDHCGRMFVCFTRDGSWFCANSIQIQEYDFDGLVQELAWSVPTNSTQLSLLAISQDGDRIVSGHEDYGNPSSLHQESAHSYLKVWDPHWCCTATIDVGPTVVNAKFHQGYLFYATQFELCVWCCSASQHIVYHPPVLQGAFSCLCADDKSLVYGTNITDEIDDSCGDGHGTHELSGVSSATSSKLVFCSINLD